MYFLPLIPLHCEEQNLSTVKDRSYYDMLICLKGNVGFVSLLLQSYRLMCGYHDLLNIWGFFSPPNKIPSLLTQKTTTQSN